MKVFDLDAVVTRRFRVRAPPDVVRKALADATGMPISGKPLTGRVGERDFAVLRRVLSRRNLRPVATGTLTEVDGGTEVSVRCALPGWARLVGRGILPFCLFIGAINALGLFLGAFDGSAAMWWGMLFIALVWMPIVGVGLSGFFVSHAVDERTATPDAIQAVLEPLGLDVLEAESAESASHAARRVAGRVAES